MSDNKLIKGLMTLCASDESLPQAILRACEQCEAKLGQAAEVVLVHMSVELTVAGLEVRHSPHIGDPRLCFVGWEKEEG